MRTKKQAQWIAWNEREKTYVITDQETAQRMLAIGNPYGFNRVGQIGSEKLLMKGLSNRGFSPIK